MSGGNRVNFSWWQIGTKLAIYPLRSSVKSDGPSHIMTIDLLMTGQAVRDLQTVLFCGALFGVSFAALQSLACNRRSISRHDRSIIFRCSFVDNKCLKRGLLMTKHSVFKLIVIRSFIVSF
jgi:hypothetical protein